MGWWSRLTGAAESRSQPTAPEPRPGGVVETKVIEPDGRTFDQWVADMKAKSPRSSGGPRVKVETVKPESLSQCDLRSLSSVRARIKGSANWVTESGRSKFGGTEYLLVREPTNKADSSAVAIYGKGRKVGYVSAAKAAAFAPLLDSMPEDAFVVGGTSTVENSIRLWVDLPTMPALREFTASQT
jgi:HIRAN domain